MACWRRGGASVPAKLTSAGRSVTEGRFSSQGTRLVAADSTCLEIKAGFADGPDVDQKGAPVGDGCRVRFDGLGRAVCRCGWELVHPRALGSEVSASHSVAQSSRLGPTV